MKVRKSNGEMSVYIPGAFCLCNEVKFTLTPELIEDLKDDPNASFYYPSDAPAYCIFTYPDR